MTLTNIRFPKENPFYLIKVRHILGWWFLLSRGIYFQIAIISSRGMLFDGKQPLVYQIVPVYLSSLILGLVWRQCRLAGIEIKYLVGKVPDRYQWLPLVGLAIATVVFSISLFQIFYYFLSFIVPFFVLKILNDERNSSILITASETFSPALYYLIFAMGCAIQPIFSAFVWTSIILQRWAVKWGNIPAIIAVCLLYITFDYEYFISIIISFLIHIILYTKNRSLLIVIIFSALESLSFTMWNLVFVDNQTGNVLDVFRSQIQLGVLFFALSAPWVIGFIYKNWSVLKGPLPYFANAAEAEKIKADSET